MFERKPPYIVAGWLSVYRNALFISVIVVFGVPNSVFTLLRSAFCLQNLGLLVVEGVLGWRQLDFMQWNYFHLTSNIEQVKF